LTSIENESITLTLTDSMCSIEAMEFGETKKLGAGTKQSAYFGIAGNEQFDYEPRQAKLDDWVNRQRPELTCDSKIEDAR
jgi:hypothetical protein